MIEITRQPISPEVVINRAKSDSSGCVVTYVGLIRNESHGKPVLSVEYQDPGGNAQCRLQEIADQVRAKWPVNNVAITHRIGILEVGDMNLVVAIAAAHREEGLAACRYAVDLFKECLPTRKKETYQDGSILTGD
ncbi:MAG TPA: molybdenum cofactor biosynthesis protein MoaE [Dehalococcoidia bacterium]|nr:molybdenum cofactor biosynthesis protein MoaE [Dehalococcoidia bacterium]